ncbi:hypothetical protein CPB83DRAFT_214493 [Crepidotus variabilis]|uniref:Uncharacterized protein n=1 Tax=Crepidotus variabilis TaxID=179855 RepID=A0A9P6ERI8_9AGAR|nr:hypothetical protein CPB83DRAFT_214493 [Crepidotus variabilis]
MPGPMVPSPTTQLPYQQQGNQHLPLSYPQFHSAPHDHQLISSNGQATSYPPNPYPPAASSPHSVQYPPNSYSPARSPLSVEYQAQQVPHQSPLHPGSRGSSTPLSLDTSMRPMKVEMPPTPLSASNLHSSSPFSAPMHPRQPQPGERQPSNRMSPRINTQTHHRPPQFGPPQTFPTPAQIQSLNIQEQHPSVEITTMSPNDMYINPPAMDEHQQGYAGPNEYVAPQQRPPEHLEHIQSGSTTPDEPSTHAPLKRNSVTMLEGAEFGEDSQKKPRLDDTSHQTSEQSYDEGSYMSAQSQRMYAAQDGSYGQIYAPAPSEPISAPLLHQSMSTYGMDSGMMYSDANTMEEEDMEYEVEVGPDGLRLVRDCLEEIFRTPEGGGRVCGLCLLRQQRNPNIEPPMPFINASDDDLEMHCLSEHEKAWTIARQVD